MTMHTYNVCISDKKVGKDNIKEREEGKGVEYIFTLKKLRDIDLTKYEAYGHEDVHMSRDSMNRSIKMWINEPRKVIWDNTAADDDAENVILMTEMDIPKVELEEARQLAATLARQMDLTAMSGEPTVFRRYSEPEDVKAEAKVFSAAIKTILRAAGLSIAWHEAPAGAITPWMDDHIESSNGREAN